MKSIIPLLLFFATQSATAVTVTIPAAIPDSTYSASFTDDATGYYENNGVTLQFSPFIGFASGSLESGLQVIEISPPELGITPVDSGDTISWPGLFSFPSSATGTWRYSIGNVSLRKDLLLSEPAIDALPSATGASFFPGCPSPWVVVGDIGFQIDLAGAQLYADGEPFGINDATYARTIEVKSSTGELYFTLDTPMLWTESGDPRDGWIYYDGAEGVVLYCFAFEDWPDAVLFDPTVTVKGSTYVGTARSDWATKTTTTTGANGWFLGEGDIYWCYLFLDKDYFFNVEGWPASNVTIEDVAINMRVKEAGSFGTPTVASIYSGLKATPKTSFTINACATSTFLATATVDQTLGATHTFQSTALTAYMNSIITSASETEDMRGLIVTLNDGSTKYFGDSDSPAQVEFIVTYSPIPKGQLYDDFGISSDSVLLTATQYEYYSPSDAPQNSYYFTDSTGDLVQSGTTSSASYTINGLRAITEVEIPAALQGSACVLYSSNHTSVQEFVIDSGAGGMTLEQFYGDNRSTPKPEILSIVKSVSDQVTNSHAQTDAYTIATYNKVVAGISSVTESTLIPSTGFTVINSDINIDNQGSWIALMRGLSLSNSQPNAEAYLMANNVVFATWTPTQAAASAIEYSSFQMEETIGTSPVYVHQLAYTFPSSATGIYDWFGFVYDGAGGYSKFGKTVSLGAPLTPNLSGLVTTAQAEIHMASMVKQSIAAQMGFADTIIREVTTYLASATIERATTGLSSADSIYCPSGAFVAQDFYMLDAMGNKTYGGTLFDYYQASRMKPIDLPSGTNAADWMTTKGWTFHYVP